MTSTNDSSSAWVCVKCKDVSSPSFSEMIRYLTIEDKLEKSTMSNLAQLSSSSSSSSQQVPKNIFEKLKNDTLECVNNLGRGHWLYLECARTLIQFFLRVALSSPAASQLTKTTCLEFALRWSFKFVAGLNVQRVIPDLAPSAATSYAVEAAKALLVHCPNSEWRIHAALMIQMAVDVDKSFVSRNSLLASALLELASKSLQIYNDNNEHCWTPQSGHKPRSGLDAILRTAELVDADECGLLNAWETHLADRVSALLQRGGSQSSNSAAQMVRSQLNLPPQQ